MNIWIRVTKSAGTSFSESIKRQKLPITTYTVNNKNINNFSYKDEDFKFSIIRNPYDKAISSYKWLTIGNGSKRFNKLKKYKPNMTYEDFLKVSIELRNEYDKYDHKILESGVIVPKNKLTIKKGTIQYEYFWATQHLEGTYNTITTFVPIDKMDLLIKLENINNEIKNLEEKIGKSINIEHKNRTRKNKSFVDFYSDKVMIPFMDLYKEDVNNFGYEL